MRSTTLTPLPIRSAQPKWAGHSCPAQTTMQSRVTLQPRELLKPQLSNEHAIDHTDTIANPERATEVGRAFLPGSNDNAKQSDPAAQENN